MDMQTLRVRFINFDAQPINCLAFREDGRLAVSRGDCSIEIWATRNGESYYRDFVIPGRDDGSIEALVWCKERLFSAGLTGCIQEWDLWQMCPKVTLDSDSGPVWSMAANSEGTMVAVGCEEGQVRLLEVFSNGLGHLRAFDKQEGRILSLAWHPNGRFIITGGADGLIRKYDTNLGRCVLRITLEHFKSQPTLVWDVKCFSDGTILSADSCGKVNFWNGVHGTLMKSFQSHKADVLRICVNEEEDTLFASGIDPKITRFQKVQDGKCWVVSGNLCYHTHDVRCLALSKQGLLVSGGVDTNLVTCPTSSFLRTSRIEYPPFTNSANKFSFASIPSVLMHQGTRTLKLWQLGISQLKDLSSDSLGSGAEIIAANPVNILEIKAKGPLHILSSALSNDACFVAFCNTQETWLYRIETMQETYGVQLLWNSSVSCHKMLFTPDGNELVIAAIGSGGLNVLPLQDISKNSLPLQLFTLQQKKKTKEEAAIVDFKISSNGAFIACVTFKGRIYLYNLKSRCLVTKIPHLDMPPIVYTFNPDGSSVFLFSGEGGELFVYSIAEQHLSTVGTVSVKKRYKGQKKLLLPNELMVLSAKDSLLAVYDNYCLMVIRGMTAVPENSILGTKRQRQDCLKHQLVLDYQVLLFAIQASQSRLIVVEKPMDEILRGLPPTFERTRYGT